jgi:hypothetical protein
MQENIIKIKETCLKLGFPEDFINCLHITDDEMDSVFCSVVINDSSGLPLCSVNFINTSQDDSKSFLMTFDFIHQQEFLKKLWNNDHSCSIMFDGDLNFVNLQSSSHLNITNEKTGKKYYLITTFQFDINSELHTIHSSEVSNGDEEPFHFNRIKENMLSIDDETILIEFIKYRHNPSIIETVPEFYIPSAYDFNSEEFKSRISLAKMMMI